MSTDDLRDLADYFGDGGWEWADGEPFDGAEAVARVQRRVKEAEAERDRLRAALRKIQQHARDGHVQTPAARLKTVSLMARNALNEQEKAS